MKIIEDNTVKLWILYMECNKCSINVSMLITITNNVLVVSERVKGRERKGVRNKSEKVGRSQIMEDLICILWSLKFVG